MKRFLLILTAFTLLSFTPAEAQTPPPTAGRVPKDVKIVNGKADLSNVPDLIEVTGNSTTVVGYAKKADVFTPPASGILDVWDRSGKTLVGRLHPEGAGFAKVGEKIPAAKATPRFTSSPPAASTQSYIAGPEVVFTPHLISGQNHYCGVGHAQIGDAGTVDKGAGAAFTRASLWYGACNTGTSWVAPTGWIGAQLVQLQNNQVCGTSIKYRNPYRTYFWGVTTRVCWSDPPGWQEYRSVGGHELYDPYFQLYVNGTTLSPWQLH